MARLLKGLAWLGASILLVVLAWVLSNVYDEDPLPLAPQLKDVPVALEPRENAYFGLVALWSEQDDYVGDGVARADAIHQWLAEHPVRERDPKASLPPFDEDRRTAASQMSAFINCERHKPCWPQWEAKFESVANALAAREPLLLPRCRTLATRRFEEVPGPADLLVPFPAALGTAECVRALLAETLVAWRQGRGDDALRSLELAHRMGSHTLQGSRSLITHMVALRQMTQVYDWAAHMVAEQPAWAGRLASIAAPLPPAALDMRRAFRYEAAFDRTLASAVQDGCASELSQKRGFAAYLVRGGLCDGLLALAFHVEQTRNERQPVWVAFIDALGKPVPVALDWLRAQPEPPQAWWRRLAWRNSGVRYLQFETPMRSFAVYLARSYDVELQRLGLLAALALADERQDIHATLSTLNREPYAGMRLHWDAGTRSVAMTLWESVDTAIVVRLPTAR